MITRILIFIVAVFLITPFGYAATSNENFTIDSNYNIEDISIGGKGAPSESLLEKFSSTNVGDFLYSPDLSEGKGGILDAFTVVAFNIKNTIIILAAIFLAIAVIRLLFTSGSEENVKKWRNSIIWVSVGIFLMQSVFSIWGVLKEKNIDSTLGWSIGIDILAPIIQLLQGLASFGFLIMIVYAFYTTVGSAGDEEGAKKGRRTILYGIVGFFLIRLPEPIIKAIYGGYQCEVGLLGEISCGPVKPNISSAINIVAKIITYLNGFIMLICVLLVIYAGWLVFISAGDEEKIKKAKSIILYVLIGFIVLIASHAIFKFFILQA